MSKLRLTWLPVMAGLLVLTACAAPAAAPTTAPTVAPTDTVAPTLAPTVDAAATQTAAAAAFKQQLATGVAATLTAQPTATPTNTAAPTATPTVAASATTAPTAQPSATRAKPAPVTPAATQPPAPATQASAPLYSTASGGPQGYVSTLGCTQPGNVPCQPVMAVGDKAFSIKLEALDDAVPAIFVPFGLSVEKDGANVADMYMTVVSGWLNPGEYAMLGTSRNFKQPGHYVIRTNGCYVTRETYPQCTWGTVNGTIVTFDIQ
jgi:hypothetical protein